MANRINFKLDFNGETHRFASAQVNDELFRAVKAKVASIVNDEVFELFWKDEDSTVVLDTVGDLGTAIEYAQWTRKSANKPPCVHLAVTVAPKLDVQSTQRAVVAAVASQEEEAVMDDWPSQAYRDRAISRLEQEMARNRQNALKLGLPGDAKQVEHYVFWKTWSDVEYNKQITKIINAINRNWKPSQQTGEGLLLSKAAAVAANKLAVGTGSIMDELAIALGCSWTPRGMMTEEEIMPYFNDRECYWKCEEKKRSLMPYYGKLSAKAQKCRAEGDEEPAIILETIIGMISGRILAIHEFLSLLEEWIVSKAEWLDESGTDPAATSDMVEGAQQGCGTTAKSPRRTPLYVSLHTTICVVGAQAIFELRNVHESERDNLQISVTDPKKNNVVTEIVQTEQRDVIGITFVPQSVGVHEINIIHDGIHVSGSPFKLRTYDSTKIIVGAVPDGTVHLPVRFLIDASSVGLGNLQVAINGGRIPSKAVHHGKDRYEISFVPHEPINHSISVRLNTEHVAGSPYTCRVFPAPNVSTAELEQKEAEECMEKADIGVEHVEEMVDLTARRQYLIRDSGLYLSDSSSDESDDDMLIPNRLPAWAIPMGIDKRERELKKREEAFERRVAEFALKIEEFEEKMKKLNERVEKIEEQDENDKEMDEMEKRLKKVEEKIDDMADFEFV